MTWFWKVLGAKTSKTEKMHYCIYILHKWRMLEHIFAKNALYGTKKRSNILLQILYKKLKNRFWIAFENLQKKLHNPTFPFFDIFIKLHRWFEGASLMHGGMPKFSTFCCSHFFKKLKFSKILNFCVEFWWFLFKSSLRWTLHRQLQCLKIITLDVNGCAVDHGETLHFSWDKICICICFFQAW